MQVDPYTIGNEGSQSPELYGLMVYGIPLKPTVLVSSTIYYLAAVAYLCTASQLRCVEQPCNEACSGGLWDKLTNRKHTGKSSAL